MLEAYLAALGFLWSWLNVLGPIAVFCLLISTLAVDFIRQRRCSKENGCCDESSLSTMSLEDLGRFNGTTFPLVYCSLQGRVYDVSTSANFAPTGSYGFLAGADATVGMGKMSYDRKYVNSMSLSELTQDEWTCVDGWVAYMDSKYRHVAMLKEFCDWQRAATTATALGFGLPMPRRVSSTRVGQP